MEFKVPGMSCGHCRAAIEKAVGQADPEARVEVDLDRRQVRVTGTQPRESIAAAIREAGYEVEPA